jgi:hypothetical protein
MPPTLDQTVQTETHTKFDTHKNAHIHKNNERLKALFWKKLKVYKKFILTGRL